MISSIEYTINKASWYVSMCLTILVSGVCVRGFALQAWHFAKYPSIHWANEPWSSGDARSGCAFCSHAGVLGWTDHFGIVARDFWGNRTTSCNQAVSVITRVQRSGELPLKMPQDSSLEVNALWVLHLSVCVFVCVFGQVLDKWFNPQMRNALKHKGVLYFWLTGL